MILIFDLDNTLLDTERFKKDKSAIFGITPKENELQGDLLFKKRGLNYNPKVHIKFLRESGRIKTTREEKKITAGLKKIIKNIDDYLLSGVEDTLIYLKNKGCKLFLMTLGDLSIQKPKVNNSCIKKYFEKIIYEEKDKSQNKFIKDLANSSEDILIINDRDNQALEMQKVLGSKAKIFLVKGPFLKNTRYKGKIYNSVAELKSIL